MAFRAFSIALFMVVAALGASNCTVVPLPSLAVLKVYLPNDQGERFADDFEAMMRQHRFSILRKQMKPDPHSVFMEMTRGNVLVTAANPFDADEFTVGISLMHGDRDPQTRDEVIGVVRLVLGQIQGGRLVIKGLH